MTWTTEEIEFYAVVLLAGVIIALVWGMISRAKERREERREEREAWRTMEIRFPEGYEGGFTIAGNIKPREEIPPYVEYQDIPDMEPSRRSLLPWKR